MEARIAERAPESRREPRGHSAYDVRFRRLLGAAEWASLPEAVQRRFSKRIVGDRVAIYSGVIRDGYEMQSVQVLEDARVEVLVDEKNHRYTVEASIPLESLGLSLKPGLHLAGDMGVTHGDSAGKDTVLRTYWNNQKTGLIADEVFELKMEPNAWGQFLFE